MTVIFIHQHGSNLSQYIRLNGSEFRGLGAEVRVNGDNPTNVFSTNGDEQVDIYCARAGSSLFGRSKDPFKLTLNFGTKTGYLISKTGLSGIQNSGVQVVIFSFTTLTNVQLRLKSPNSSSNLSQARYTISYTR